MSTLSKDQELALGAIIQFLGDATQKEMVLAGAAGTGKTFLISHILTAARGTSHRMLRLLLGNKNKLETVLSSTTNKAATIMFEATQEPTRTIHSVLGLRPKKNYETGETAMLPSNRTKHLEHLLLIIDEASMIDEHLLSLIRNLTTRCKVLYILDEYQLAPVKKSTIPVIDAISNQVRLTTIQRQKRNSPIITCSQGYKTALDTGVFPQVMSFGSNVQHVSKQDFKVVVDAAYTQPEINNEFKILAWANARVHQYNKYIRELKNLPPYFQLGERVLVNSAITYDEVVIHRTDKIVQITRMDVSQQAGIAGWSVQLDGVYDHFIAENPADVLKLKKQLKKDKKWLEFYRAEEIFVDLRPLYAGTVTKSQGSTYNTVFIDVADIARNSQNNEIARLMYTAITRASNKVYLCGTLPTRVYK